ncbi:hypothetical protein [Bradyrhizobium sp.]|uniref:hypothetical protein n=1 Tax=Bradyrhizobium sp. TaxID=376 RepID=UPI003C6F63C7
MRHAGSAARRARRLKEAGNPASRMQVRAWAFGIAMVVLRISENTTPTQRHVFKYQSNNSLIVVDSYPQTML